MLDWAAVKGALVSNKFSTLTEILSIDTSKAQCILSQYPVSSLFIKAALLTKLLKLMTSGVSEEVHFSKLRRVS